MEPIIGAAAEAGAAADPPTGTLPFTSTLSMSLRNRYLAQTRKMAASLDVTLASGASYSNWRAGSTNVERGDTFSVAWPQNFPALGTLVGVNEFLLTAVDVTPVPFNQPPYPPAGDVHAVSCTVTGFAP